MRHLHACALILTLLAPAAGALQILPWPDRAESPPPALNNIGFDQNLDAQVPLEIPFRDEAGRTVALTDYFGKRPVVLSLVYYECPALCNVSLNGLLRVLRALSFNAGEEFEVLTVSIDPSETPALATAKRDGYLEKYRRPDAALGWHFLTGEEESIRALADAVGFRYEFDPATGQFAHAAGLVVLTPAGRVARYQFGVEYSARDLRLSLIEASANRIGTRVDQILLYCFNYDAAAGKYTPMVMNIVRASSIAAFLAFWIFFGVMMRRDRRTKLQPGEVPR